MPRRLKVLMSAYACEPGKGSEPEVGWQWALQMARFHDVTVLTRENNRVGIERALMELRGKQPLPDFVYHEESLFLLGMKRHLHTTKLYYLLWQRSARNVVSQLQKERHFDLFHHVTFAGVRYPAAIWGHGVPCIWGPIGGAESVPVSLLPWKHPRSLAAEISRNTHNLLQSGFFQVLPRRARASTVTLVSTAEMQRVFATMGFETQLMPTIGLNTNVWKIRPRVAHGGPLKLLFVGNIITLKGVDLALRALKESGTDATLTLIGDGNYLPAMRQLTAKLELGSRVCFRGRVPRQEVLKLYSEFDAFIFPSLHDTGGYSVIEAMFNELPVICLDCGGPAVATREGCGVKVPLGTPATVVAGLADAIKLYAGDRERVRKDGHAARESILKNYNWETKGEQMNEVYQKAADEPGKEKSPAGKQFTGIGRSTNLLHRLVSLKGFAVLGLVLLMVGMAGFLTLAHLKKTAGQIVNDTLPGLVFAGQANAYMAEANRTLLFIISDSSEERKSLRDHIDNVSQQTSGYLAQYSHSIFGNDDRKIFDALVTERTAYINLRNHILDLASAGDRAEALKEFNESLMPAQAMVKSAGDRMFDFNIRQGELRSKEIMTACTFTQLTVALIGVVIFVLGFFIGLFR